MTRTRRNDSEKTTNNPHYSCRFVTKSLPRRETGARRPGDWLRRLRRCLSRCSSRSPLRASTEPHYKILLPSSLVSTSKWAAWLVSNCARRTTTASSWRVREHGEPTMPPPLYVSIISNRASNSCPQAVQWMQSDSTVNSSDLIPMPPQSGQRASWIL